MTDLPPQDRPTGDRPESRKALTDSSGVPWTGRDLPAAPFAGDEGLVDPGLAAALRAYRDASSRPGEATGGPATAVHASLAGARVFVPIVAVPGRRAQDASDAADLALITVTGPDGRRRLPAFTDPNALAAWRAQARPVPVPARQAALAAVSEGCELLHLDPAGPIAYLVGRPALWALAQGRAWQPSYADPAVTHAVEQALGQADPSGAVRVRLEPGERAELRIVLGLADGWSGQDIDLLTASLSEQLAGSAVVAERVDSVEVSLHRL